MGDDADQLFELSNAIEYDDEECDTKKGIYDVPSHLKYLYDKTSLLTDAESSAEVQGQELRLSMQRTQAKPAKGARPRMSQNAAMVACILAYHKEGDHNRKRKIRQALSAMSNCDTPKEIKAVKARCMELKRVPTKLVHQRTIEDSNLLRKVRDEALGGATDLTRAMYETIVAVLCTEKQRSETLDTIKAKWSALDQNTDAEQMLAEELDLYQKATRLLQRNGEKHQFKSFEDRVINALSSRSQATFDQFYTKLEDDELDLHDVESWDDITDRIIAAEKVASHRARRPTYVAEQG